MNTISITPGSRGVQDFPRRARRVIKAATGLNGNLNRALFAHRNSAFGPKTPEQLVSEGRADYVLRHVASLKAGAAG
jgi:hypothetical protein